MATNENIIWNVREGETIQDESGRRHDVPWDEIRDALNVVAEDLLRQFCLEKPTPEEVGGLKIYDESGYSYVLHDDIRSLILKRQKTQKNVPAYPARLGILAKLMYGLYLRRPEIECIVDRTGMPLEPTMQLRKYVNNAISNNRDLISLMPKTISYFENLGVVEHPELKYMHWPDYNKKYDWMRLFSPINESLTIFKGKTFPPGKVPIVVWINNEKPMRDVQDNSPGGQDSGEAPSMPDVKESLIISSSEDCRSVLVIDVDREQDGDRLHADFYHKSVGLYNTIKDIERQKITIDDEIAAQEQIHRDAIALFREKTVAYEKVKCAYNDCVRNYSERKNKHDKKRKRIDDFLKRSTNMTEAMDKLFTVGKQIK